MAFTISRRTVLTQLAAIPITASFARPLLAQAAGAAPQKRLVCFMQSHGTKRINFWPEGSGPEYPLPPVGATMPRILNALFTSDGTTDNGLRAQTTLLKGLTWPGPNGTNGNLEDVGFIKMFTGAPLISVGGAAWGSATSFDQIMRKDWNGASLTTAVYGSDVEVHPKTGFNARRSFSYAGPGVLNLPFIDPYTAFSSVFPPQVGGSAALATRQRIALRQSALDNAAGELTELRRRLGPGDSHKLDSHLTVIRSVELQLQGLASRGVGWCASAPTGAAPWFQAGYADGAPPPFEVVSELYDDVMIQFMASLVAAAIQCNVTRVASLQFGYGNGEWKFGMQANGMPWLNPASTGDPAAGLVGLNRQGQVPVDSVDDMSNGIVGEYATWIGEYFARTVQKVALELLNTPDGTGTLLDRTLIVWANDVGRSDGSMVNLPIVHIGLVGDGQRAGGRVIDYSAIKGGQAPANYHGYHALTALGHNITEPQWSPTGLAPDPYSGY